MKHILIIFICLFSGVVARGQIATTPRSLSGHLVDSLRSVEAYQYGKAPQEGIPQSSPPKRLQPPPQPAITGSTVRWGLYILLGVILLAVSIVVIRQFSGSTGKVVDRSSSLAPLSDEELISSDLETLASQAEAEEQWRLALRYRYLGALQRLQDRNFIDWHPYKTDSDYLLEIKNAKRKAAFAPIVRAYTYVWYGQKQLSQSQYNYLNAQIQSLS